MMLFNPEVSLSIKEGNMAGRQGGEEGLTSATVKQRKTRVGECYLETRVGVTSPQRLKQPMK
jgi:hypothetical protein